MNEPQRQMLEVKSGLNSPFWKWLAIYLREEAGRTSTRALTYIPGTLVEMVEREQDFGRAKALAELVEQIPQIINDKIVELEETS